MAVKNPQLSYKQYESHLASAEETADLCNQVIRATGCTMRQLMKQLIMMRFENRADWVRYMQQAARQGSL